jgi:hypothetical protein
MVLETKRVQNDDRIRLNNEERIGPTKACQDYLKGSPRKPPIESFYALDGTRKRPAGFARDFLTLRQFI